MRPSRSPRRSGISCCGKPRSYSAATLTRNGSISIRIGTAMGKPPQEPRHLSTWLGEDDLIQLVMRCIEAPEVGYMVVWAASANTRSYWDNTGAEKLGFRPQQNAEAYADEILKRGNPLDPVAQRHQGGGFVTLDYTRPTR